MKGAIVVIGNLRWGRGATLKEAKRNFQREGGRLSDGYVILTFDADTEFEGVDDMGRCYFTGNKPAMETVLRRRTRR